MNSKKTVLAISKKYVSKVGQKVRECSQNRNIMNHKEDIVWNNPRLHITLGNKIVKFESYYSRRVYNQK